MHEWGIADSIIERLISTAKDNDLKSIQKVGITLGRRQGIGKDEFAYCLAVKAKQHDLELPVFDIREEDSAVVGIDYIDGI